MSAPWTQAGDDVPFWVLIGLFAVGEYAARFRSWRNRSGVRAEGVSLGVVVVCIGVGVIAGFRLSRWLPAEIDAGRLPLYALGLVLMAAGLALRQWAIRTLGRFFTVDVRVHSDQVVVDRGPYRVVRHPAYTALVVFFVGLGLALSNWASVAALAVLPTIGLVARIFTEERVLTEQLGEPYRRFAAHRRRLFPGIW